jgi:PAS domain S-box-containing protein
MTGSRLAALGVSIPLSAASIWLCARYARLVGPNSANFMPHGYCYLWDPRVVWLHVISDALIGLSYFAIPVVLVYFLRRRRNLPFNWIFWMFAGFILACGTTHFMEIWNIWHADYVLAGFIKAITAVLSVLTAAMLIPLTPKAVALPGLQTLNRELEAALKNLSEQKFALDQHAIVATTDVQGTITYVNDKFCQISKYSREELIGQNHRLLNSGEHSNDFFREMYRDIAGGRVWRNEICNRAKDGAIYWVDTTVIPFLDSDGKPWQYMAIRADITRRKADELEIAKLNEDLEGRIAKRTEQLQATNHELEAFSYSVSHDLRAPLRHIGGFSRTIVRDFGSVMAVEARVYLELIEDAVCRMDMMVEALLRMAVLRRQSLQLSHSELNTIVADVVSMLQPECDGRDVEWRIAKLPAMDCDPTLMAQVFQNLLGNALKYSRGRAPAVIEVNSIQQPGKPAIIFVRDNGVGFNMRYPEKLFGVFQRFHTEAEFEGTGVGLAIVHRIIQKHGGMIWAETGVDHGATFYFALQMTEQIGTAFNTTAAP